MKDVASWTTNAGHPGYTNPAVSEVYERGIVSKMFAARRYRSADSGAGAGWGGPRGACDLRQVARAQGSCDDVVEIGDG